MHKKIFEMFKVVGLKHFYGDHFDSRFYVSHLLSNRKDKIILDIGCGAGILLNASNADLKIGTDIEFESLRRAKEIDQEMELIQSDAQHLPFKNNYFSIITAMHLFPVINNMGADWKKAVMEVKRSSKKNCILLITGANRTSKHFEKTHPLEHRKNYLSYLEQAELLKDKFSVLVEGYGPHSKYIMYPFKIIYKIPDKLAELMLIEKFLFRFLCSKKYLKNGRSYIITCKKK